MECEYCRKSFTSAYNMKIHKKTTKSCLKLQEQYGITIEYKSFDCEYCTYKLTTKKNLSSHQKICKSKVQGFKISRLLSCDV